MVKNAIDKRQRFPREHYGFERERRGERDNKVAITVKRQVRVKCMPRDSYSTRTFGRPIQLRIDANINPLYKYMVKNILNVTCGAFAIYRCVGKPFNYNVQRSVRLRVL